MQLARSGMETATVADLGIRAAAEAIAQTLTPEPEGDPRLWPEGDEGARLFVAHDGKLAFIYRTHAPGYSHVSVIDPIAESVQWTKRGLRNDAIRRFIDRAFAFSIDTAGDPIILSKEEFGRDALGLGFLHQEGQSHILEDAA
jgi:hypothetical protein